MAAAWTRARRRPIALSLIALAALLGVAGVAAAQSKHSSGTTQSTPTALGPAGSVATGATCPGNQHATGGGLATINGFDPATKAGAQTFPQTNYPPGKAKWRGGSASESGEPGTGLTTYVRCEKPSFGKTSRVTRTAILASGIAKTVVAHCPSGAQALGGGYSVTPSFQATAPNKTTSRLAVVQSSRAGDSGWRVSATNPSQPTAQLTVSALCEKKGRDIKPKAVFSPLAAKSRTTVTAKCAKKQHVDAGGFAVTPLFSNVGVPVVDTSAPADSRTWKVTAYGGANIPTGSGITAFVYCKSNEPPG